MGKSISTLLTIVLVCSASLLWAQQEPCATNDVLQHQLRQDPGLADRMQALERRVQSWISTHKVQREADEVYTIPVVVHIVWLDSAENLPDSIVHQQLEVLNRDFRKMNEDTSTVRPRFKSLAADIGIEFCLAKVDPEGNPTTGITHTEGESPKFFGIPLGFYDPLTNSLKYDDTGGKSGWPVDRYLNIWVGNIGADLLGLLGYAQLPQTYRDPDVDETAVQAIETDGIAIDYRAFGSTGEHLMVRGGRSTTHEVGHWLGLRHTWGDGDCSKDDFVSDTPITDGASQECDTTRNSCVDSTSIEVDEPDMFENYMDYALECSSIFTTGQKERMIGYLLSDSLRFALINSNTCQALLTSISPVEDLLTWELYPNPTKGQIQIQWQSAKAQSVQLEIMDLQGRVVYRAKKLRNNHIRVDLSTQAAGMYMVRMLIGNHLSVKKVILE